MNKFVSVLLCLITFLSTAAQTAEFPKDSYYLRGSMFYTGNGDPWAYKHLGPKFVKNSDGILSVKFPGGLDTTGKSESDRNFAITTGNCGGGTDNPNSNQWPNDETIVIGPYDNVPTGEEFDIYFGGNRNGILPSGKIAEIQLLSIPTNTDQYVTTKDDLSGNNTLAGKAGKLRIILYDDTYAANDPTAGVKTLGQSNYGLQVWAYSRTSSETANWDVSGGLAWPIRDSNDPQFAKKYRKEVTANGQTAVYMMFQKVANNEENKKDIIIDIKRNESGNPLPFSPEEYNPDRQVIRYHPGSNVYVIDFKHDLVNQRGGEFYPIGATATGLYVEVPNASAKNDEPNAAYAAVPRILRSGVRFGVYNTRDKDDKNNNLAHKFKYLKYGRGIRLNSQPYAIGHGSWDYWNGIPLDKVSNPTVEMLGNNDNDYHYINVDDSYFPRDRYPLSFTTDNSSTFYNKLGDNRLLSEYNMFIDRIILEVVNEGKYNETAKDDNEQVFIRFEGRYDLNPVTTTEVTYSYSDKGMGENKVGDEPNIYVGNTIRCFDRGFARFYGCYDPQYHDKSYSDNLMDAPNFEKDIQSFGLIDYTASYETESTYEVVDLNGNPVSYIGYENKFGGDLANNSTDGADLGLCMKQFPAKFSIKYKSVNFYDDDYNIKDNIIGYDDNGDPIKSHFMAELIQGSECTGYVGRYLRYSANPPSQIVNQDAQAYGNATNMVIQCRRLRLLYDHYGDNRPAKVIVRTKYFFPFREPNNVPEYTLETNLSTKSDIRAKANLTVTVDPNSVLSGYNKTRKYFAVDNASISGSEYAYGAMWDLVSGETKAYYPVTRWTLSAKDRRIMTDNDNTFPYVKTAKYGNYGDFLDDSNKFKSVDFGRTVYYVTDDVVSDIPDNGSWSHTVDYTATMVYTFGNVKGMVLDADRDSKRKAADSDLGSILISEKALQQYVSEYGNNAYAILYNNGDEGKTTITNEDGTTQKVAIHTFTLSPGKDTKIADGYTPGNISVSLREVPVKSNTATEVFSKTTVAGIEDVLLDTDYQDNVITEYYNLQGVRVSDPVPGTVYIVRRGNTVTKELAR